jgi:hypothetical protein
MRTYRPALIVPTSRSLTVQVPGGSQMPYNFEKEPDALVNRDARADRPDVGSTTGGEGACPVAYHDLGRAGRVRLRFARHRYTWYARWAGNQQDYAGRAVPVARYGIGRGGSRG